MSQTPPAAAAVFRCSGGSGHQLRDVLMMLFSSYSQLVSFVFSSLACVSHTSHFSSAPTLSLKDASIVLVKLQTLELFILKYFSEGYMILVLICWFFCNGTDIVNIIANTEV